MDDIYHRESGSTAAKADPKPRGTMPGTMPWTMPWARLKGAAFLTGICIAVVISMVGWLGGLALVVLELCELLFS